MNPHPRQEDFDDARYQFTQLNRGIPDLRRQLSEIRRQMDTFAASTMAREAHKEGRINGGNDQVRKAQLAELLAADAAYGVLAGEETRLNTAIEKAQVEMQDAADRMRGARLAIEYATGDAYRIAYAHGSSERLERDGLGDPLYAHR